MSIVENSFEEIVRFLEEMSRKIFVQDGTLMWDEGKSIGLLCSLNSGETFKVYKPKG
jgi:hypothetical protein